MSPEKQNVAIAAALGYTRGVGMNGLEWWTNSEGVHDEPPYYDFVTSLDAMHVAEASLTDEHRAKFVMELHFATEGDLTSSLELPFDRTHYIFPVLHATAAQRAEAFLRTIGKWEDGK